MGRLFLLVIVALCLAPGTWLRSASDPYVPDHRQALAITPLPQTVQKLGALDVAGIWELESGNRSFGSYSALVTLGSGRLLAVSDNGNRLEFSPPGEGGPRPHLDFFTGRPTRDKRYYDAESLTRNSASGQLWVGYEGSNSIARFDANLRLEGSVRPPMMRSWPSNAGPEAMTRLQDGRFLIIGESDPDWLAGDFPGLLFQSDPVDGGTPLTFRFETPEGYRPVDMAQLPDGRVLILLRKLKWRLPPGFAGKLMVADPGRIASGAVWNGEVVADLDDPLPTDNFEGLAVAPGSDGGIVVWLISDDNSSSFQRTLLMKLNWRPDAQAQEKARGTSRAPY